MKERLKGRLIALSFAIGLATGVANAGIPVSVIGDVTATVNQIETMTQWALQIEEMKNQYGELKRQYEATTGSRGLGSIFNDPAFKNYLPDDWKQVYDDMQRAGKTGMSSDGKRIYDQSQIFDRCKSSKDVKMIALCEADSVQSAEHLANLNKAFDTAQGRLDQIQQLMGKINQTSDPKDIAELQARIQAENALIQNEQSKVAMYSMIASAQDELRQEQMKQANMKNVSKKGGVRVTNVNF